MFRWFLIDLIFINAQLNYHHPNFLLTLPSLHLNDLPLYVILSALKYKKTGHIRSVFLPYDRDNARFT